MRWMTIATVVMAASVAPWFCGCGEPSPTAKKVTDKIGETFDAMKTWGIEKKDEFVKSSGPKLDELKAKFAEAKASASKTSAESVKSLEEGWSVVEQKFDAMKAATGAEWARQRDAFVDAYDAYKKRLANSDAK